MNRPAAALVALALLALPGAATARELRPWDAPLVDADHVVVPALPPEYQTQDELDIRLSYQPSTRDRVRSLHAGAVAIRAELSAALGREVLAAFEIRVAAAPAEMARIAPVEQLPAYAGAVAFSEARLVVMSAVSPLSLDAPNLDVLLRHALAHLALDEALGGKPIPRWLHEGWAVSFAGDDLGARAETLTAAALGRGLLGVRALEASFPAEAPQGSIAWAQAADYARFLSSPPRRAHFLDLLERVRAGEPFDVAFTGAYTAEPGQVELSWRQDLARRYGFLPALLGATLLWIVVGLALAARRALGQRRRPPVPARRQAGVRRSRVERAPALVRGTRGDRLLDDEIPAPLPREPEVPKVEHDGRWYTLH